MPRHFSSGGQEHPASKPTFAVVKESLNRDCFYNRYKKGGEKDLAYQCSFCSTFYTQDCSPLPGAALRPGSSDSIPALGNVRNFGGSVALRRLALTSCLLKTSGRPARIMSLSPDGKWASDALFPSGEKRGHDRPTLSEAKAGTHRTIDAY